MKQHTLFVEKYRPNTLDNYIGNQHLKSKVKHYLEGELARDQGMLE